MSKQEYMKIYAKVNRDKLLANSTKWNLEHREIAKENNKKYHLEKKRDPLYVEKRNINSAEWHKNNPEKRKQYRLINTEKIASKQKEYDDLHKEEHAQWVKEYMKTPEGKMAMRASRHNRIIREKGFSKVTKEIIQQVYEENIRKYTTLTCELCFKAVVFGESSLEHFTPICRKEEFPNQDLNSRGNLGVAHLQCNKSKSYLTSSEWFRLHPEYLN